MSERNDLCASLNGERLSSRVAAKLADARGTCEPASQVVPTLRQGHAPPSSDHTCGWRLRSAGRILIAIAFDHNRLSRCYINRSVDAMPLGHLHLLADERAKSPFNAWKDGRWP
jgi:hypothetical protein